jgi:hypothetical protein
MFALVVAIINLLTSLLGVEVLRCLRLVTFGTFIVVFVVAVPSLLVGDITNGLRIRTCTYVIIEK